MLSVQSVSRRFGGKQALDDVSLTLASGEIICLVGQSGCGKSSLLRLIAGVDAPDAGSIWLNGAEIAGPNAFVEPEDRSIGFMFQDYALFPHLTVAQNIGFGLGKLSRADARTRVDAVMARIGVGSMARRYPHTLSGGEQQRVALARALAPQPQLLLMDEPFSNLDRGLSDRVRTETLAILRDLGTAAIIVTHDPEEALAAGDRVALMQDGRIIQAGTGRAIHDQPQTLYAAEFFRPCNRMAGLVAQGAVTTPLGAFATDLPDGQAVTICIRQHALHAVAAGAGAGVGTQVIADVIGSVFLGDVEELLLRVDGLAEPLVMRGMGRAPAQPGDSIRIGVDPDGVMIFPVD